MKVNIPKTMKAWRLCSAIPAERPIDASTFRGHCTLDGHLPVPEPRDGEVLVQVLRGTILPVDFLHASQKYFRTNSVPYPRAMGFEGVGIIVQSKGSWFTPRVGTRVGFYANDGGTFGEFATAKADEVLPIPAGVSDEIAACSVGNPLTAVVMVDQVKAAGHKVFVNTAAAGALGRMVIRYAKNRGLDIICIVRRAEQADICREEGAKHVLNSSDADFEEKLKAVVNETGCSFCYDCIGGTMTNVLLKASPRGGVVSVYDTLSTYPDDTVVVNAENLIPNKKLEVYDVLIETETMWTLPLLLKLRTISNEMGKIFRTTVAKSFPLEEAPQAYEHAINNMTAGKVQIVANWRDE